MEYVIIIISAVFVNNIVLIKFLGICPFIGVSNKVETSIGMTGAVAFVMVIATIVTYLLQVYVLEPLHHSTRPWVYSCPSSQPIVQSSGLLF